MGLSAELISQFAKITKDTKTTKTDTIVYGTAVVSDGVTHVKIDGSDLLTPVGTTIEVNNGERVTVMIKDHKATITGSTTSPSASTATTDKIAQDVVNNKAIITKELQVETARINNLIAENATIKGKIEASEGEIADLKTKNLEVDEKLTAAEAEIERLDADKITAKAVDAKYATIENLDAANAAINNLRVTQGNFEQLTTNNLSAVNGSINELKAKDVTIENTLNAHNGVINNLESTYAKITDLEATNAEVDILDAGVAKIDKLIFGSASGDVIQSTFANAVIAQLGDAQIKSAMIQNVDASKINAGTINTNNVNVQSDDGKFFISDETMQISDDTRVRVQIGKDASGDYSINIWDTEGKLMFSKGGITDSAIKEAIIRDDMVAENANISASKLDIHELFTKDEEDGTYTVKGTAVYFDAEGQSLSAKFTEMNTAIDNAQETANKNASDMANIVNDFNDDILNLQTQIDGSITTWFYEVAPTSSNEPAVDWTTTDLKNNHLGDLYYDTITGYCYRWQVVNNVYSWQRITDTDVTKALADAATAQDSADQKRRVFYNTPTTPYDAGDLWVQGGDGDILRCQTPKTNKQSYSESDWVLASKYTDDTAVTELGKTVSSQGTDISVIQGQISSKIWQQDINTATGEMNTKYSALEQNLNGFKTTVSDTYTTKADFENMSIGGRNLFGFNKGVVLSILGNSAYSKINWDKENKGFYITILSDAPANMIVGRVQNMSFNGVEGESYAFSGIVSASSDNVKVSLDICDQGNVGYIIGTEPQKISFSAVPTDHYTVTSTSQYNGFFDISVGNGTTIPAGTILYFKYVKIERGTRSTDWTPAPEDMATDDDMTAAENRIVSAESRITQTEKNITSVVKKTETNEQNISSLDSKIDQTAGSITLSVQAVEKKMDDMEIGGRNLLIGTETPLYIDYTEEAATYQSSKIYSLNDEILADPKAFLLSLENSYLAFSYDIEIESIVSDPNISLNRVGGYFTFNITDITTGTKVAWYGTHSAGNMVSNNSIGNPNSLISIGDEPVSFSGHYAGYCDMSNGSSILQSFYANPDNYTVTATSAYVEIRGSTTGGVIKNVKLEVGNKPTRWTPAPEDVAEEISSVKNEIKLLDEKIITTVTDEYGNTSLVQTGSNWDFNLGGLEKRIEDVESKTSHIKVTEVLDDDGSGNKIPALVLFEDDQTTFKSVFTNKYLNFVYSVKQDDGTTEDTTPTRMTTTGMETEDMTINKNLNHVGFQWRKRANGNYGLSWIGGDE